jgi:Asp/Glu/hydantoin racemase
MTELAGLGDYREFLVRHAAQVLGKEAGVQVEGLRAGTYHGRTPTSALGNAFVYHRAVDQIIDNAIRAERDGFDAFVIGSFSEPMLREIRSAVDIPVTGILESSMLVSLSLGRKVAPIANAPEISSIVESAVEKHGLQSRVLPCVSLDPPMHEAQLLQASISEPGALIEAFQRAARQAIAHQGAEVIVPAEAVLASVLVAHQVTHVDDAPVVDVLAIAWRYALMMTRLRQDCSMGTSRAGAYARRDLELVQLMAR